MQQIKDLENNAAEEYLCSYYRLCRGQLNTPSTLLARRENKQKRNSVIEIQRKLFGISQATIDQNCSR